jgi:GNAT superfamily N-acetyltransferase
VRTRFFRYLKSLTDETAQHLCNVSYQEEMAFAAVIGGPESGRIVGPSCYFLDPKTGLADVAYTVDSEWQGSGLGSLLQARTIDYARTTQCARVHSGRPRRQRRHARRVPALGLSRGPPPGRGHLRGSDPVRRAARGWASSPGITRVSFASAQ